MEKCCGNCGRWNQDKQERRPSSLRSMFSGTCELSGKNKKSSEDCWYHTEADQEEIVRRGLKAGAAQLN